MESLMALSVLVRVRDAFSGPLRGMANLIDRNQQKLRALGQTARQWGRNFLIAGGVASAGIGGVATTASGFEATMSRVGAVSRASQAQMVELTKTARELGATTQFSASQAAEGMTFMAMAGFDATKVIAAMPGALDLARAAGADLGATSDISTNILSSFRMEAGEMGRVGDVLTATFTGSNTTLRMLGETMSYAGGAAAGLGVSLEETAALAGMLGNVGSQGSRAGTVLRALFSRLAAPEGVGGKTLRLLGVNVSNEAGGLRNIVDILKDLQTATKGLGELGQIKVFKNIFGEEAFVGVMELAKQAAGGGLAAFVKRNREAAGEAKRVAATMGDNFRGAGKTLTSSLEAVTLVLGDQLLPLLKPMVEGVTEIIRNFKQWAEANPEMVRNLAKFALWGTGLLFVLGALATVLGIVAGAIALLGGPVTLGIALFAGWSAIIGAAVVWWDDLTAAVGRFFDALKTGYLTRFWNAFAWIFRRLADVAAVLPSWAVPEGLNPEALRKTAIFAEGQAPKPPPLFPEMTERNPAPGGYLEMLQGGKTPPVRIENIHLPGVKDAHDFIDQLKALASGLTTAEAGE